MISEKGEENVSYRYSMDRKDKKLAGVCSTLGDVFNIDPTFLRIGFAALWMLAGWKLALAAYIAAGLYLHVQKNKAMRGDRRLSEYDRMDFSAQRRTSIKEMRDTFDENDRRMMAIDHHISTQNDDLAREIEALREEKQ